MSSVAISRRLDIEAGLNANRNSQTIYNGSFEDTIRGMADGRLYIIPPDGETLELCQQDPQIASFNLLEERGPIRVFDGTLKVFDVFGAAKEVWHEYRQNKKAGRNPRPPMADQIKITANRIVAHLVGAHWHRGLCLLTGDPVKNEAEKKAARERFISWDKKRSEQLVDAYNDAAIRFRGNPRNAGSRFRPMSPLERRAQEKLDMYKVGLEVPGREMCPVEDCGYWAEGKDAKGGIKVHLAARHPGFKAPTEPVASAPTPDVQVTNYDEDAEAEAREDEKPTRRRKTA